jgi:hypothetical protein
MSMTGRMLALWCTRLARNRSVKALSRGIPVLNPRSELLPCRAAATFRWGIAGGSGHPGETPLQTVLREPGSHAHAACARAQPAPGPRHPGPQ